MTGKQKSIITNLVVGLVIVIAVVALNWQYEYPISQLLCDGFFVAAVVVMGFGGIKAARNKGSFDVAAYGLRSVVFTTIPYLASRSEHGEEKFLDYQERKRTERKSAAPELLAGGIYLALSVIMLIVYSLKN